jgi:NAD(P)-dependent dehydrogenase (short-subunit alcohol dehydrogenase family)
MKHIRNIFITGGSRGLGAAISRAFYENGDRVIIASRTDSGLAKSLGDRARFIQTDVRNINDIRSAFAKALDWAGKINVLINNAGYSAWRSLPDIDEKFWDDMIATNLKAVLFASQSAAGSMGNGDSIINISSLAGKRGSANNTVYCASKFGVNAITQSLAKELGPKGIRVNAVCPVYVRTAGLEEALEAPDSPTKGANMAAYLEEFAKTQTALGVLPTDAQVAASCLFLASEQAGAITGQCINIDCGVLPQ